MKFRNQSNQWTKIVAKIKFKNNKMIKMKIIINLIRFKMIMKATMKKKILKMKIKIISKMKIISYKLIQVKEQSVNKIIINLFK